MGGFSMGRRYEFDEKEITDNIMATIKEAKKDGTVGMSLDCLRQCTKTPYHGPVGTNAQYFYKQEFERICLADKSIRRFLV